MDSRMESGSRQDKEESQRMKSSAKWLRKDYMEDMNFGLNNER